MLDEVGPTDALKTGVAVFEFPTEKALVPGGEPLAGVTEITAVALLWPGQAGLMLMVFMLPGGEAVKVKRRES